jgi:hypothetical protein
MRLGSARCRHVARGALLAVLLGGCGSGTTSPQPTIAQSTPPVTQSATVQSASPASASPGVVSIVGTNEIHEQQTSNGGMETFDLVASFTAAGTGNQMSGTAQLSGEYSVNGGCSWSTGPLSWGATLDGMYEVKPYGGLFLDLRATPATSQIVTIDFGCGAVAAPGPFSLPWPGAYGMTLVNGVYDSSLYTPATAPSVGGETITWHIEQAP